MDFPLRVKRFFGVCLVVIGLVLATTAMAVVFFFLTMFFFIGSSGKEWDLFLAKFAPVAYFISGAIFTGGALATVNSICVDRGWWWRFLFTAAVVGGAIAVAIPAVGMCLMSFVGLVLGLNGALFSHK